MMLYLTFCICPYVQGRARFQGIEMSFRNVTDMILHF